MIDRNLLIEMINDDYRFLSSLSVREYILYKKWEEINSRPITDIEHNILNILRWNIPVFDSIDDLINIDPVVIPVVNKKDMSIWTTIRRFQCALPWNKNPGRHQKYLVQDRSSSKYLGVISLGSDFTGIGGRNKYIGWNIDHIMKNGMLIYTANGSSIVPLQPFGYNCVGGKLLALLALSNTVVDFWNSKYAEPLVGITTTSLYGGLSQYSSLKHWRKCDSSTGKVELELSSNVMKFVYNYMKQEGYSVSGFRQKKAALLYIGKEFGIKVVNNAPRGVYWCDLYDNTKEFLRMETTTLGNKKFDNSVKSLVKLWKEKYASKRIGKLNISSSFKNDTLSYDYLYGITIDDALNIERGTNGKTLK